MSLTNAKKQLEPLDLRELTEILIKHYGLTEGKFNINVEFNIGAGSFGPSEDRRGPGLAVSIARLGLSETEVDGPYTVDASKRRKSAAKSSKKA